ncbi:zinc C3HC4 type (RING finger) [Pyrrhoderma noxium]|uniref:Zinc C3HC4 type (RING finger) n=1 Tax=Pyrrhoderma noxium TaxID=2282107 RepID=A0A286UMQ7_9AGAM|nr:zinc C3HC4 type (RING finger) [Pyrrhoderma noxium]
MSMDIHSILRNLTGLDAHRRELISKLPSLTEQDLIRLDHKESCCPICFTPFLAVLAAEEMAQAMDSPAVAMEDMGVTRLADTCGHLFCRKDISTWIMQNDTCPTCRRPFVPEREASSATQDPSETDAGNADDNGAQDPEVFFSNMIRELLGNRNDTHTQDTQHRDDRDEFIGLYS